MKMSIDGGSAKLARRSASLATISTVFAVGSLAAPAFGHHSFAATYDAKQPITIEGVVSKMSWRNPHAFLYVDVPDDSGKIVTWEFELSPSAMLLRYGWTSETIVVGEPIVVRGFRARDGTQHLANAREVKLNDGRTLIAGPGADSPQITAFFNAPGSPKAFRAAWIRVVNRNVEIPN
jgi:hypothetical protein